MRIDGFALLKSAPPRRVACDMCDVANKATLKVPLHSIVLVESRLPCAGIVTPLRTYSKGRPKNGPHSSDA
jgi:hypothetical protein